ncbi:heterokaryon incompatibility protein-domain-containing protein [Xylariaceae sp. FL0662B]|nr:heterokaryon incompatibility protein-domain-containing protein [Xylariaceae sp. FL0662B]
MATSWKAGGYLIGWRGSSVGGIENHKMRGSLAGAMLTFPTSSLFIHVFGIVAMRLINTDSYEIHEFQEADVPRYAILSHTWGEGEVVFQEMQAGRPVKKLGYEKIDLTCKQACRDGLEWAWVDTCCIDKTKSAELSEAINSMYHWYEQADVCYTYISDGVDVEFPYTRNVDGPDSRRVSRWFTRAWTLQELIAPRRVAFYDREWKLIGYRGEARIERIISSITGIPQQLIQGARSLSQYSVAQKMSWAAHRSCTRLEDVAYCLLGLFDINMPLLYGEGDKAFTRLQEEILKQIDDHSLLCWTVPRSSPRAWTLESVFAKSPQDFAGAGDITGDLFDSGSPSVITSWGLQTRVHLAEKPYHYAYSHLAHCDVFEAALNAAQCDSKKIPTKQVSILLIRRRPITPYHSRTSNRYTRVSIPEPYICYPSFCYRSL